MSDNKLNLEGSKKVEELAKDFFGQPHIKEYLDGTSEADKIFEEEGYNKKEDDFEIVYTAEAGSDKITFTLDKINEVVVISNNTCLDLVDLKALSMKVEELGWWDESSR